MQDEKLNGVDGRLKVTDSADGRHNHGTDRLLERLFEVHHKPRADIPHDVLLLLPRASLEQLIRMRNA